MTAWIRLLFTALLAASLGAQAAAQPAPTAAPIPLTGAQSDLEPLLSAIGEARFVLLERRRTGRGSSMKSGLESRCGW